VTVIFKKNAQVDESILSKSLEKNIKALKEIIGEDGTIVTRQFQNRENSSIKCCIIFSDGMIDDSIISRNIINPIIEGTLLKGEKNTLDILQYQVIASSNVQKTSDINKILESLFSGYTVLFTEGFAEALLISTKGWQARSIDEPEGEKVLRGPREGFTESIITNLSMIRRKLKTPDLKFKFRTIGIRTRTRVCICYIDSIANKNILNELEKRLDDIEIDGILDSGYIQEIIKDSPFSPFKTIGNTEKPDVVAGKILEGRIAIIVDGSPIALTLPFLFIEYLQSSEDYYSNYYFASLNRILRIIGGMLTVLFPAFYVALVTFQQEMIPTPLILSISSSRQGVPFPTAVEVIVLLLIFEILRETETRMPAYVGQALSIVGALVLGQAAVQAKFVSAPVVIIVAVAGITGLMIPKLKGPVILLRYLFILLASLLGMYGIMFGIMGLFIYLFAMRSFGIPYMLYLSSLNFQDIKDTAIRAPRWYMEYRPRLIAAKNIVRMSKKMGKTK
jgi:spore germination protein KA